MVGSAIVKELLVRGLPSQCLLTRDRASLDLVNQAAVQEFFKANKIDQVYLAAARVGGILANNDYPADFIYENLMIQSNVLHAAFVNGVKKVLFLGSSCIYPREAAQPMQEEALLTGKLEPTNEPYAVAKIAGIKLCESYNRQHGSTSGIDFRSVMPTNLYGPGDNYHAENSHVIPGLIRRFHEAKIKDDPEVKIWGSGTPLREFLYVDDMAKASVFVMNLSPSILQEKTSHLLSHINVGSGEEVTIFDLAKKISSVVGYNGRILTDPSKPDGTPRKFMCSKKLQSLGWRPAITLDDGLRLAYEDYLNLVNT